VVTRSATSHQLSGVRNPRREQPAGGCLRLSLRRTTGERRDEGDGAVRAWTTAVGAVLLVVALAACGEEPTLTVGDEAAATASASPTAGATVLDGATGGADSGPTAGPTDSSTDEPSDASSDQPSEQPSEQPSGRPSPGGPDLDGDGRADAVSLVEVPDMGWSFDVRLADGRETSAPLPTGDAVHEDVAVTGAVDLDRDRADEVLVRTLRAVGGENVVAFRLDGDGVWLVRTDEGVPWELSTSGGMTGPRSYDCTGGEVRTRESERQADGTYRATTWRWALRGHVAGPLGGARDDALTAEEVSLDPSTCSS
jgi:hypothetical protein